MNSPTCFLQIMILISFPLSLQVEGASNKTEKCPCHLAHVRFPSVNAYDIIPRHRETLCILDENRMIQKPHLPFQTIDLRYFDDRNNFLMSVSTQSSRCSVVMNVTKKSLDRIPCPGMCFPTPSFEIPLEILKFVENRDVNSDNKLEDFAPLCSLSVGMSLHPKPSNIRFTLSTFIERLFWRKIQECYEPRLWGYPKNYPHLLNSSSIARSNMIIPKEFLPKSLSETDSHPSPTSNSTDIHPSEFNSRRSVQGMILWIGSQERFHVLLAQHSILHYSHTDIDTDGQWRNTNRRSNNFYGSDAILGWLATDKLYPCAPGSTSCRARPANKARKQFRYHPLMPNTRIPRAAPGWNCAQRRPLRALAHVLLLFDPNFLLLCDDDTYVNLPLLHTRLMPYIDTEMRQRAVVVGEFMDPGKISPNGFLVGGAGYLLGKAVLKRLAAFRVREYSSDGTNAALLSLALARDIRSLSHRFCPVVSSAHHDGVPGSVSRRTDDSHTPYCIGLAGSSDFAEQYSQPGAEGYSTTASALASGGRWDDYRGFTPTAVRLIDLCVFLMSGDNTCYHSDHAVSRCLFYGADALVQGVVCNAKSFPGKFGVGLCHEVKEVCDTNVHVTCHRFAPSTEHCKGDSHSSDVSRCLEPVRLYNDSSHYDEFSSGHDTVLSYGRFSNDTAYGNA